MAHNNKTEEKKNKKEDVSPIENTGNQESNNSEISNPGVEETRPSVRDEAPSADNQGRETVSKGPLFDVKEPENNEKKEETVKEQTEETVEKKDPAKGPIAGGMSTISDRQALLARDISKTFGEHTPDEWMDLYNTARDKMAESMKTNADTEKEKLAHDRSCATMLALYQVLVNSDNQKMKEYAATNDEPNRMSFGISPEDTKKLCGDIANPDTDWTSVEDKVYKADRPQKLAEYAKTELETLKDKKPNELVDYYHQVRKEASEKQKSYIESNTPESREEYDRSFAKLLAGDYMLRQVPGAQAKSALRTVHNKMESSFGMSVKDLDNMMEFINVTPTPETPSAEEQPKPEEKNEYPDEPEENVEKQMNSENPQKAQKSEVKQEPDKAQIPEQKPIEEEKKTPEQLKDRLTHVKGVYEATTGQKIDDADIEKFGASLGSLDKIAPELRGEMFGKMFREHTKLEMQSAISTISANRKNGKEGATFGETTKQAEAFMKAQFDYFKATIPALADAQYPLFGGMQPTEIRDMQMSALRSLPQQKQTSAEKKEITSDFTANKNTQTEQIKEDFRSCLGNINKEQGVKFSAGGFEEYLRACWKESSSKDLDSQRTLFSNHMRDFQEKIYDTMLSKINGKTDLKKQLQSFDNLCSHMETLCKANGWMNPEEPHALFGNLTATAIKDKQTKAVSALPKNTAEKSADDVEKLSGDKAKQENKIKKKENKKVANTNPKEAKKQKKQEKALDSAKVKEDSPKTKNIHERFLSEVQKCIDKVPKDPENPDNPEARDAISFARAIENKIGAKGKAWRFFHPFRTKTCNTAVQNILSGLKEKGYTTEIIDSLMRNPEKPENDPVVQDHDKQKKDIEDVNLSHEELERQKNEFSQKAEKSTEAEQITVPEADNIQEIVNPKERSPFIVPEKNKQLEKIGPEQETTEKSQQMGPPTGP